MSDQGVTADECRLNIIQEETPSHVTAGRATVASNVTIQHARNSGDLSVAGRSMDSAACIHVQLALDHRPVYRSHQQIIVGRSHGVRFHLSQTHTD